jgi:hypothetical protein
MGGTSTLCVTSPTQRLPAHNTGGNLATCDGTFSDDWNSYVANSPSALGCPFLGGEQVWVQAWVRDPGAVKNSNLSAALTFQLCP